MDDRQILLAVGIFVITYGIIVTEKVHRASIAMFGATMLLTTKVISQDFAIETIDFNTIGLLIGMMVMVNILRRTGVFGYLAIRAAKSVGADPWRILLVFCIFTALASALLDNVTTILLIVPITLVITDTLALEPIPFVVPLVLMSNIGGTATLIGDPPNIMIGSATGLGFMDFILNLGPAIILISIVVLFVLKFIYGRFMMVSEAHKAEIMAMDQGLAIRDKGLLIKSLLVLSLTLLGFMVHQVLHFESATVALVGAATLLLVSGIDPEEIFLEIEWPTIFFFTALFILVGGLEAVGVIDLLAQSLLESTQGNMLLLMLLILWGSAIASAFLDNIPFVATMIPLIKSVGLMSSVSVTPLWWALALGACLGGNGTMVGASANVIVGGMLKKHGSNLTFLGFMKVGFPIMILSILVATLYMTIKFF